MPNKILNNHHIFDLFGISFSRLQKFDHFSEPKHGYDNVNGDLDSPASFDEIERPPLRHIDKYVRADLCGLSARYTVAFMAMMGFIISFGMKCNLSAAKSERERIYRESGNQVSYSWNVDVVGKKAKISCLRKWKSFELVVISMDKVVNEY